MGGAGRNNTKERIKEKRDKEGGKVRMMKTKAGREGRRSGGMEMAEAEEKE